MKLGLMGGTFNPPHMGHLEAARHAREALTLDLVLFVPTNVPPHKTLPNGSATTEQRCEMVRRMISGESWAALSTIEIDRGGSSYTVDTLREIRAKQNLKELFLIIGTDMLMTLPKWREPEAICRLAGLAVIARDEGDRAALKTQKAHLEELYGADIRLIDCPALPVSSTELRGSGANAALLPSAVAQYIECNRLYR